MQDAVTASPKKALKIAVPSSLFVKNHTCAGSASSGGGRSTSDDLRLILQIQKFTNDASAYRDKFGKVPLYAMLLTHTTITFELKQNLESFIATAI